MSPRLAAAAPEATPVGERYSCAVPTTCQPPSSWVKDPWPASIREIGNEGVRLALSRRFERGSGLAIEIPSEDGSTGTSLARVVDVASAPDGGWLLHCRFISELSDEEVRYVLSLDPTYQMDRESEDQAHQPAERTINGVLFQTRSRKHGILRWIVRRLDLAGTWPLERGKVFSLQVGPLVSNAPPLQISVRDCRLYGSYWVIDAKLLAEPSEDLVHFLMTAPTLGQGH